MKPNKRIYFIALILISVGFGLSNCHSQASELGNEMADSGTPWKTETALFNQKKTIKPTNLVIIDEKGDFLPPRVSAVSPDGGQEIGSNGNISVQFNQNMNQDLTSKAWKLTDSGGKTIDGKILWISGNSFAFTPNDLLIVGEQYTAEISITAQSVEGIPLQEVFKFYINVADDLIVSQVFPADGSTDIENNSVITIIFNRPVVPLTTLGNHESLIQPVVFSPEIPGNGEWLNTSVYVYRPDNTLNSSTAYIAKVEKGITDSSGSQLKNDFTWQFTTAAPTIASFGIWSPSRIINPENNHTDVLLESTFSISFNQPMEKESVEESIEIYGQLGERISTKFGWPDNTRVIITPTIHLPNQKDFTLLINETAKSKTGGTFEDGIRWNFSTLPYPEISQTSPVHGETQSNFSNRFGIQFNTPMKFETFEGKIDITPELGEASSIFYNSWSRMLNYYGLEPSTNYTVNIYPGLEDIYGNEIIEASVIKFRTADRSPSVYFDLPFSPSIYTLGNEDRFFIRYVNVNEVEIDLYKLPVDLFAGLDNGTYNRWEFLPAEEMLVNNWVSKNKNNTNTFTRAGLHLEEFGGKKLTPGFYFLTVTSPDIVSPRPFLDSRMIIIAEANLTFKTTSNEALLWLTDLNDGEPIEEVPIDVFDDQFNIIGSGTTDSDGILQLDLPENDEIYRSRYALTREGSPFAFSVNNWGSGVSPYDFGIWSNFYDLPDKPVAYTYTDRPIYRPGQKVHYKGVIRQNNDLEYTHVNWKFIEVEISSYNEKITNNIMPISEFGTFYGEFTLDDNAALGYYSIQVREAFSDDSIGGVGFSVAEYRKPEFQLELTSPKNEVIAGNELKVVILASYYSGGSVGFGEVEWAIQAKDFKYSVPGKFSTYSFNKIASGYEYLHEESYGDQSQIISSGKSQLDENGRIEITLPTDLNDNGEGREYTFETTITDVAGTSVSGRTELIVHKAEIYPGVKPANYVGKSGDEQSFDLVVVDWAGNPSVGAVVDVEIAERKWYSVQEVDEQGYLKWISSVEDIPVQIFSNLEMDESGQSKVIFTPKKGGVYKAKIIAKDRFRNEIISEAYIWISGDDYVSWRQSNNRRIEIVSDKETYQPGDVAEVLITSPFVGENYALVTIERGQIRDFDVVKLSSNSAVYKIPITIDMAPNIYFSVLIVKGSESGGRPDFRLGILEIYVKPDQMKINIDITTEPDQAEPGEEIIYKVKTTDYKGDPVQAEVSLALVDKAVLQLGESNSLPILDYFYNRRSLSVRTSVPLVYNIEHYVTTAEDLISEGEGMGSGGGKGNDMFGVYDIRADFKDTAFWRADLLTDKNGYAKVKVQIPDNLTVWQMDARAVSTASLVGDGINEITSTKPLIVRPQTPRFFIGGDKSVLGAAIHNNTNQDITANISLVGSGLNINSKSNHLIEIKSGSQEYITWAVEIKKDIERVDLVFSVEGGGFTDSSKPTLGSLDNNGILVYRYQSHETIGTSGVLLEAGTRTEGLQIAVNQEISGGELNINLSPSLTAGMNDSLNYLEHFPYECIEQTISKFLPNVLTHQAIEAAGIINQGLKNELNSQINIALQRLYNWQRQDGGWGWWQESSESDPLNTAYVVFGMVKAQRFGYEVNEDVLLRGINYLLGALRSVDRLDNQYLLNRQAFILYVLNEAGKPQVSLISKIFDIRQSLSLYARAYLVHSIWMNDENDTRINTIISDFNNAAILSATGIHWEEKTSDFMNWNTDTRTTAIILGTLITIDPDNELNPNVIRWLMTNRNKGHWRTTQENSWVLISFAEWLKYSSELNSMYGWAIALNGLRIADGSVSPNMLAENIDLDVDIGDLIMDEANRISIAKDDGNGTLYYSAHLDVYLPVDQIEPIDRGIIIGREYFRNSDDKHSISRAKQGEILLARITVITPNDLHYFVIDDPLPAGLEAVDQSLQTNPDLLTPQNYDYESMLSAGWGWWHFDHIELRDERVVISGDYLPAGTYMYTYLVRASTPGIYSSIPPTAQEFYFPEVFGRGKGGIFEVSE